MWEEVRIQYRQVEIFAVCEGIRHLCHVRVLREEDIEKYEDGAF
jgi:hypothetical protein